MKKLAPLLLLVFLSCSKQELIPPCTTFNPEYELWEGKTIPYYLDARWREKAPEDLKEIERAIAEFEKIGFHLIEYKSLQDVFNLTDGYIFIEYSGFNRSYIGKRGGEQQMWLNAGQNDMYATALHELGHAIGLHHAHKRTDIEKYVNINWDNIKPEKTDFFQAEKGYNPCVDWGRSVMSYGSYSFGINPIIPTMTKKDGSEIIPSKEITEYDKALIKELYGL